MAAKGSAYPGLLCTCGSQMEAGDRDTEVIARRVLSHDPLCLPLETQHELTEDLTGISGRGKSWMLYPPIPGKRYNQFPWEEILPGVPRAKPEKAILLKQRVNSAISPVSLHPSPSSSPLLIH